MSSPEYFDIIDVKNAHMDGQKGRLNRELALIQWVNLKHIYQNLLKEKIIKGVDQVNGQKGCEDMVFTANQSFPWLTENGEKVVVMSKMRHISRQKEVPFFRTFYEEAGYKILDLQKAEMFEGMGDTIPHPGRRLLWGGYGHRSSPAAYEEISEMLNVDIITLELKNDLFYHLDTCFVPLDEDTVMITPLAFTKEGLECISKMFKNVIEVPAHEAVNGFALNAHVMINKENNSKVAVIQEGNPNTSAILKANGYKVFETNTSEYMKSGGSVFCMKMMYY